jgi:diguanylate cyclase (GGDEF)-like protein/PAS domain S-box-containing protein
MLPWYRRGETYARRSLAIRTGLGDVWGQGQSLHFYGVVLYAATRYRECVERCREAVRLLERTGDQWEVNTARWHIAFALYRLGDLGGAVETARRVHEAGVEIGDWQAVGISLGVWSKASGGRVPAELIASALERSGDDAHTGAELLQADAVRLLHDGRPAEACAVLERARVLVKAAGLRQEYVAPVLPWLATALRGQVETLPPHAVTQRAALLRRARRTAARAVRMARRYRNNLPHALREQGLVAVLSGRERRGRSLLGASIAVAEAQEARFERAQSLLARGRVGVAVGWSGAAEDQAAAERMLAEMTGGPAAEDAREDRWVSLSLADRFERVLGVGRRIASASSREAVFAAVNDAAVDLLRGESCLVLDVTQGPEEEPVVISGSFDAGFSRTLAYRAVVLGRPLIGSAETTATSESIDLASVRSALYAPIVLAGQATACFCVGHHEVDGLFGPEEIDLAEYIATLAGAALENVAGSEARFRSLVQQSSDVITIVSPTGLVTYQSPSVERVLGHPPDRFHGQSLYELVHGRDVPRMAAALREAAAGSAPSAPVECRWRHHDGSWRQTETLVKTLLDDPSVGGIVLNTRDVTERKRAEDTLRAHLVRLSDIAETDPLTGLGNRRFFDRFLAAAVDEPAAVLSIDLDNLKVINDLYGHEAGDAALRAVAPVLRGVLRDTDIVARIGGDEFAALLPGADLETAVRIGERLRQAMYGVSVPHGPARISVGCAAGPASVPPRQILREADEALFRAKRAGRDRVEAVLPGVQPAALAESRRWESALDAILTEHRAHAVYQPILRLADRGLVGYEGLARPTAEGAEESVEGLFRSAQRAGVSRDLDWICRRAVLAGWHALPAGVPLFLNVGVANLLDPLHDVDQMLLLLRSTGCSAHDVVLEITEREAVHDLERLRDVLASYREAGFRFALDDLGEGHSTLAVLSAAVPEFVKLAGVLTRNAREPGPRYVIGAMVAFAEVSGSQVIAENLESEADVELFRALGVGLGQGYALGRPGPAVAVS